MVVVVGEVVLVLVVVGEVVTSDSAWAFSIFSVVCFKSSSEYLRRVLRPAICGKVWTGANTTRRVPDEVRE